MSLLLPCPHCGRRPVQEFRYGGEAPARRPAPDGSHDGADLAGVLYESDNPRGAAHEWWQHTAGCRAWIVFARDTRRDMVVEDLP